MTRRSTIKDELSTHMRTTVILTNLDRDTYHIRISSKPGPKNKEIYDLLGIKDLETPIQRGFMFLNQEFGYACVQLLGVTSISDLVIELPQKK